MSHSSRYASEGVETGSHQRFGLFADRGNCSTLGLHLFLFFLRPIPLNISLLLATD